MGFVMFFLHLKYVHKCSRHLRNRDVHNRSALRSEFRDILHSFSGLLLDPRLRSSEGYLKSFFALLLDLRWTHHFGRLANLFLDSFDSLPVVNLL